MLRRFIFSSIAVMALMAPLSAQTVDEVLAKYVEASGGMAKMQAQKSRKAIGKLSLPGGLDLAMTITQKRPEMIRVDISFQGMDVIQAYDGKTGWQIDPTQGKKTAEPLSEDDLKDLKENADFDGPLVNAKEKGNTVELVGKEDVDGTPAYKLKVTLKSGDIKYVYLDADAYVEIKEETKRTIRGTEREIETVMGDYKDEGGVMMPHSSESKPKGAPQGQKLTIDKVEINPEIPDSFFQMPAAPAPAAEKPADTDKKSDTAKKPETKKQDKPKQ
jgi:outer membrane lipoprotein-sorting protein